MPAEVPASPAKSCTEEVQEGVSAGSHCEETSAKAGLPEPSAVPTEAQASPTKSCAEEVKGVESAELLAEDVS